MIGWGIEMKATVALIVCATFLGAFAADYGCQENLDNGFVMRVDRGWLRSRCEHALGARIDYACRACFDSSVSALIYDRPSFVASERILWDMIDSGGVCISAPGNDSCCTLEKRKFSRKYGRSVVWGDEYFCHGMFLLQRSLGEILDGP